MNFTFLVSNRTKLQVQDFTGASSLNEIPVIDWSGEGVIWMSPGFDNTDEQFLQGFV